MSPERGRSLSPRRSSSAAVPPPAPPATPILAALPFLLGLVYSCCRPNGQGSGLPGLSERRQPLHRLFRRHHKIRVFGSLVPSKLPAIEGRAAATVKKGQTPKCAIASPGLWVEARPSGCLGTRCPGKVSFRGGIPETTNQGGRRSLLLSVKASFWSLARLLACW